MSKLYKILNVMDLTEGTFRLRTERPQISIRAGQCFSVGIPGKGINREYSLYGSADDPYLDFLIRTVSGGCVSPNLRQLAAGDEVEINGPYGSFCLEDPLNANQHYVFLASGTGIAPFHSFAKTYSRINYKIVHGIRNSYEQYDVSDYPHGSYIPCVSKNVVGQPSMRVTDYLLDHPVQPDSIIYLCGNRNMIIDAFGILREQGVPSNNLFTEVFF